MSDVDAYTVEVVDRYRVLRALEESDPLREVEPAMSCRCTSSRNLKALLDLACCSFTAVDFRRAIRR
ncbi:MAG: hypothetical protein ACI867_000435 [Glaciecola sp.]|jgi:hypothetical protein